MLHCQYKMSVGSIFICIHSHTGTDLSIKLAYTVALCNHIWFSTKTYHLSEKIKNFFTPGCLVAQHAPKACFAKLDIDLIKSIWPFLQRKVTWPISQCMNSIRGFKIVLVHLFYVIKILSLKFCSHLTRFWNPGIHCGFELDSTS